MTVSNRWNIHELQLCARRWARGKLDRGQQHQALSLCYDQYSELSAPHAAPAQRAKKGFHLRELQNWLSP